ncbi:LppL protein [Kutzneria sp. 744]|nr:LppL protein [Kutzneria sp. 744]
MRGGKVVQTFTMPEQPGGIETIGDTVAMVDVRDATLTAYDADKLTQLGSVPAGNGPTHIVADNEGRFVVVDTRGNALLAFKDLKPAGSLLLPGTPYGAAFDRARDRMWVTLTGANEVVGVDLAGAQLKIAARFPTVRQPNTVAVDSGTGRVFVAGAADGVVEIIDP